MDSLREAVVFPTLAEIADTHQGRRATLSKIAMGFFFGPSSVPCYNIARKMTGTTLRRRSELPPINV